MKLTSYLIQKRIRSLLAQADKRQPTFCPLSEASNILLLYHIADEEQLKPGISRLQQLHKTIHRGIYLPKGEQQPDETPRTFFLSEKTDLGAWQIPASSRQEQFNAIPADLLIDLTPSACYSMRYLMLQHPCRFKVGVKQGEHEPDFYDFSLALTKREEIQQIFEHILFYLQAIRAK